MQNISILVQGVKRYAKKKDIYYIQPRTYDFPISKEYLQTILIELYEKGYIRNLIYQKAYSNDVVYFNYDGIEITYDGVEFLIVPSGHGGSQLFKGRKVEVSINPTTGNLIQTNPLSYKGSWNKND